MTRWRTILAFSAPFLALAAPVLAEDIRLPVNASRAAPPRAHERISDPLEGFNRRMFSIDKRINRVFGRRKVAGSAGVIPQPVRHGLFNFFNNLDEPSNFANNTLQLKFGKAAVSAGRFATNSTVGLFGTVDVATKIGLHRHREDLGQTMAMYGVKAGPYIYLPVFGPSTLRDKVGDRVDGMTRPLGFIDTGMVGGPAMSATKGVVQPHVLSVRERARNAADAGQTGDEYATLREFYYEQRADEIADEPSTDNLITTIPPALSASGLQQAHQGRRDRPYGSGYSNVGYDPLSPGYGQDGAPADGYAYGQGWGDDVGQAEMDAAYDAANPPLPPAPEVWPTSHSARRRP